MRLNATRLGSITSSRSFGDQLYDLAGERPNLDLNFAGTKTLDPRVTFTRASSATYTDSAGVLRSAVTNLLLQSNQFDTTWTNLNSSETAAAGIAPDGTNTAWELKDTVDGSAVAHSITQSVSIITGTTYTYTVWMKAQTLGFGAISFPTAGFTVGITCLFNLSTGASNVQTGTATASTTAFSNGWYRCSVTATATASVSTGLNIRIANSISTSTYQGDGTGTILIYGAQLEQSSTVGEYIPTTSTINSAPRFDHNPTTGESLGLLVEEARTNLSLQSEDFSNAYWVKTSCTITSNESTAPDGTLTADLWTNTGSPGAIENSITKDTTARTYTTSLWVKGTLTQLTVSLDDGTTVNRGRVQYNLSTNVVGTVFNDGLFTNTSGTLTRFPDGWVRVTMTTTTSSGTTIRLRPFFSGTGSTARIWGTQVEEGAFPTSYIPTTTATVTRAADVASITGSNFSSWYNQTEGTMFAEAISVATNTSVFSISDNSTNNRIQLETGSNTRRFRITSSGSARYDNSVSYTLGTQGKTAGAYLDTSTNHATNGTLGSNSTASPLPVVDRIYIGSNAAGSLPNNGTIKRLTYWPTRLSNTTLQQITQ